MPKHNENDGYCGPEVQEINDYLLERHGEGYIGFPTFRLVHSAFVTCLSAGEWNDWDQNIPVAERGAMVADEFGTALTPNNHAERRIIEMRQCEKYLELHDTPGWILERWMGPAYFGGPGWWESQVVPGTSLPSLGPFPYQGQYILVAGPYSEPPSGPFLDRLVEQWELMRDEVLAYRADTYVRKRHAEAEERDQLRSDKWHRESSAANMTAMQPMFSTFLEGGIARQLAAEHAGIQSNYGN